MVQSVYVATKPKNWENFVNYVICSQSKKEGFSIRQISEVWGISKSRVHRMLSSGDKNLQSVEDVAFFHGMSSSTVRRIIKEHEQKEKQKKLDVSQNSVK